MQKTLLLILCLAPCWLTAQTVDSVALRQVDSLIQVSRALTGKREFDKALEVNVAAEKIASEKLGRESAAYGLCCFQRGRIFINSGNKIEDGIKWAFEALAIQEKTIGNTHLDYGKTKHLIGYGYFQLSQYEKGAVFALDAKNIIEKTEGKNGALYFGCINNLAACYASIGNLYEAEPLFLEARDLVFKKNGSQSEEYAINSSNLSYFYRLMGNYQKSLEYALQATEASRKLGDEGQLIYANSLGNLGSAYKKLNRLDKAEPLYQECLSIYEATLGKEDRAYLEKKHDLAVLYAQLKQHAKALSLYEEIVAAKEKKYGKENLSYANSANSLAVEYMEGGAFEKAEPILVSAIETQRKILGADSDEYLQELTNLSILYNATGQYEKAEALHVEISSKLQFMMGNALHHLSERETQEYLKKFSYFQDCALSLAQTYCHSNRTEAILPRICFDNALYFKGFLLNAAARLRNISNADPANIENIILLKSLERRLGNAYSRPKQVRDSASVHHLETQANDLEKELARSIAGYSDAKRNVHWQDVQIRLGPNEAVIEFVHFDYWNKSAQVNADSTFYAALLLKPGAPQPLFIPLFELRQLFALLQTEGKPQPAFYNDLYAADKKGDQFYDLIWKPIAAALPEGTTVYCSPSGLLHRLNLGAIPTPDGKTLAEKHRLTTMGSTRQLAVPSALAANQNATAQLYGGIQYDATPVVAANTDTKTDDLAARRGSGPLPASPYWGGENDSTLRGENWNYLRWTEVEITAAAEVMNGNGIVTTVKKGAEATEESFKAIGEGGLSPRILHVATHGFFFPDPQGERVRGGRVRGEKTEEISDTKTFKVSENPMIRSGLVLAGGNHAWKTGKPLRPNLEDGILTAYEISQMNLSHTELVVLSACETGLGDLVGNEGVYGLQRAFKIAGARYLIMSLWQVPDFQTQVFMTAFYKHWLDDQMPVPEAFRATQAELRVKYGEAFKWAGFVLVE